MTTEGGLECPSCGARADADGDFCPRCGTLFIDGVDCELHPGVTAIGVCAICSVPICAGCGKQTESTFLCRAHESYEIYQGLARILGTSDSVHAQYLKGCLEQEGLHPFVYSRKANPIHIGGPEYTQFISSGDSPRVIVNEFKLLVPCAEVVEAEALLKQLETPSAPPPDPM